VLQAIAVSMARFQRLLAGASRNSSACWSVRQEPCLLALIAVCRTSHRRTGPHRESVASIRSPNCSRSHLIREAVTELGSRVRFSTNSVFLPNQEEILNFAAGRKELEGVISGFSDSGAALRAYAVVEVVQRMSMVVPVSELRLVSNPDPDRVES